MDQTFIELLAAFQKKARPELTFKLVINSTSVLMKVYGSIEGSNFSHIEVNDLKTVSEEDLQTAIMCIWQAAVDYENQEGTSLFKEG